MKKESVLQPLTEIEIYKLAYCKLLEEQKKESEQPVSAIKQRKLEKYRHQINQLYYKIMIMQNKIEE